MNAVERDKVSRGRQACCESLLEYGGHSIHCPVWAGQREPTELTRRKLAEAHRLNPRLYTARGRRLPPLTVS